MKKFFGLDLLEVLDTKTAIKVIEQLLEIEIESPYGFVIQHIIEVQCPNNKLMEYTFIEFSTVGYSKCPPTHYTLQIFHAHYWGCSNVYVEKRPITAVINEKAKI